MTLAWLTSWKKCFSSSLQSWGHYGVYCLEERSIERGSAGQSWTLKGWDRAIINHTIIGTAARATLVKTSERQGKDRMDFPEHIDAMFHWTDLIQTCLLLIKLIFKYVRACKGLCPVQQTNIVIVVCQIADMRPSEKDHVVVMERRSGRVLTGASAPTEAQLELWLQTHPSFEVVQPGTSSSTTFTGSKFCPQKDSGKKRVLSFSNGYSERH